MKQAVFAVLILMAPVLRGQNIVSITLPPCCAPQGLSENPFLRLRRKSFKKQPTNVCN